MSNRNHLPMRISLIYFGTDDGTAVKSSEK